MGLQLRLENLKDYALQKLDHKCLDIIAGNNVAGPQLGFDSEENALEVYWAGGHCSLQRDKKSKIARKLVSLIAERYANTHKRSNVTILKNAKDRSQNPR